MDLETKLLSQASAYAPLTALLGTSPFRWYSTQLQQTAGFPAVVVLEVSNPSSYNITERTTRSWARIQFTVWGTGRTEVIGVVNALTSFLDQFNGCGITGLKGNPTIIIAQRAGLFPQSQPPKYTEIVEAMIFNDTNV